MSHAPTIRTHDDAVGLVAALSDRLPPNVDALVMLDETSTLVAIVPFEPDTDLAEAVEVVAERLLPGEQLLWVSNRTGQVPADRWDDELVWEEMVGIARANGVVLLDWFVTCGTTAFSLAEFAPTPAAWSG